MLAHSHLVVALLAALCASPIAAKTDMAGCVSSETVVYGGASLVWYLPDTGEICAFLDCGGGRAPPKTTVPGCADYSGTATYTPSFLTGFGGDAVATATTAAAGSTKTAVTTTGTRVLTTWLGGGTRSPTITSAATTATVAASGAGGSTGTTAAGSASSSASSGTSSSAAATSKPSTAAGAVATTGPLGVIVGLAVGAAALF